MKLKRNKLQQQKIPLEKKKLEKIINCTTTVDFENYVLNMLV